MATDCIRRRSWFAFEVGEMAFEVRISKTTSEISHRGITIAQAWTNHNMYNVYNNILHADRSISPCSPLIDFRRHILLVVLLMNSFHVSQSKS